MDWNPLPSQINFIIIKIWSLYTLLSSQKNLNFRSDKSSILEFLLFPIEVEIHIHLYYFIESIFFIFPCNPIWYSYDTSSPHLFIKPDILTSNFIANQKYRQHKGEHQAIRLVKYCKMMWNWKIGLHVSSFSYSNWIHHNTATLIRFLFLQANSGALCIHSIFW